jgi:uncharacterized protein YceK
MKNAALVGIVALALSGCASMRIMPAGISGNEAYVSVSNVWNESEALPYAEKHCAKYSKIPKFQSKRDYAVVFDCVKAG